MGKPGSLNVLLMLKEKRQRDDGYCNRPWGIVASLTKLDKTAKGQFRLRRSALNPYKQKNTKATPAKALSGRVKWGLVDLKVQDGNFPCNHLHIGIYRYIRANGNSKWKVQCFSECRV